MANTAEHQMHIRYWQRKRRYPRWTDNDDSCYRCGGMMEILGITDKRYNYAASMNGGECYDWDDVRRCTRCGARDLYHNCNC